MFYYGTAWIDAKNLKKGTKIFLFSTLLATIDSSYTQDTVCTVYNFEVAHTHNYFVGEQQLLVHNTCDVVEIYTALKSSLSSSEVTLVDNLLSDKNAVKQIDKFLNQRGANYFNLTVDNAAEYKGFLLGLTTTEGREAAKKFIYGGQTINNVEVKSLRDYTRLFSAGNPTAGNLGLTDKGWLIKGSSGIPERLFLEAEAFEIGVVGHLSVPLSKAELTAFIKEVEAISKAARGTTKTLHGCQITKFDKAYTEIVNGNKRVRLLNDGFTKSKGVKVQMNFEQIDFSKVANWVEWEELSPFQRGTYNFTNLHINIQ